MKPLPKIVKGPTPRFYVDGEPFLILGLQWDCNSCYSEVEMTPLFDEAAKLGCNTAATPLYWESVEPEFGRYDFSTVEVSLEACRKSGLRLVPLWFASYKNAGCYYAPSYIREDHKSYQKVVCRDGVLQEKTLCPNCLPALERDRMAFRRLFEHLRKIDEERTVILAQCENEAGILGADRCYCPRCNELFEKGDWTGYGPRAGEAFAAWSIARYIDQVAAAAREEYDLPVYTNSALGGGPGQRPGVDYFSAGPVSRWLSIWQEAAPHLDLLAPDIYTPSYPVFDRICSEFKHGGNPLYIAETATDPYGRTERNVFYAIGMHGAIGYDPWAIDRSFPDWFSPPLVRRYDLKWSPRALALRDSYVAIGRALKQVASAVGTPQLRTFVQEEGDRGTSFELGGLDWKVAYPHIDGAGRGFVIERGGGEFLIVGVDFTIQPVRPAPDATPLIVDDVERGHFEGEAWVRHARVVQENARGQRPIRVEEGQVYRLRLSETR
jgi:hypothetical protein